MVMTSDPTLATWAEIVAAHDKDIEQLKQLISNPAVVGQYPSNITVQGITVVAGTGGTLGYTAVDPVSGLTLTPGVNQNDIYVDVTFAPPATATPSTTYNIEVARKTGTGTYSFVSTVRTLTNNARVSGLQPGTTYGIRVTAMSSFNIPSAPVPSSGYLDVTTSYDTTPPVPPTGIAVRSGLTSLVVSWTDNAEYNVKNGAGTYELQVDTSPSFNSTGGNPLYDSLVSGTVASVTNLTTNGTYYVRLRAITSSGVPSNWSNYGAPTGINVGAISMSSGSVTSDGATPSPVGTVTLTPGVGYIIAKWTPIVNNDLVFYDVYMSTSPPSTTPSQLATSTTSSVVILRSTPTISSLTTGTTYYVKVVARDADGSAVASSVVNAAPVQLTGNTDIAAGTITAAQIAVGTITASRIAAGTITGDRLAANTITSDRLLVGLGGNNMAYNTAFTADVNTDGMADQWLSYSWTPGTPDGGFAQSIQVGTGAISGNAQRVGWSLNTGRKGIYQNWYGTTNQNYIVSWYARHSGLTTPCPMDIAVDVGGMSITYLQNPTLTTSWQRYVMLINFTASNTAHFYPCINTNQTGAFYLEFSNLQVEQADIVSNWGPNPAEILPGTIVGNMMVANTITAAQIAANTITSAQIAANTITAAQIAANSITADRLTTSSLTSANITLAGGSLLAGRLSLSSTGIIATRSSDGATTFSIDASSGNVTFANGTFSGSITSTATITGSTIVGPVMYGSATLPTWLLYTGTYTTQGVSYVGGLYMNYFGYQQLPGYVGALYTNNSSFTRIAATMIGGQCPVGNYAVNYLAVFPVDPGGNPTRFQGGILMQLGGGSTPCYLGFQGDGGAGAVFINNTTNGSQILMYNNGTVGVVNSANSAYSDLTAVLHNVSDQMFKKGVTAFKGSALKIIRDAPVYHYRYRGHYEDRVHAGVMAHELPEWMQHENEGTPGKIVSVSSLAGIAWQGVKELHDEVIELRARVDALAAARI